MPTYDYECNACDHKFELFQSILAEPEKKCPSCKKLKLRRLIGTGAAVVFKGSGFYQTDYRSDSYKQSAAAESKSTTSDAKSESTSTADAKSTETASPAPVAKIDAPAADAKPKPKGKNKKGD